MTGSSRIESPPWQDMQMFIPLGFSFQLMFAIALGDLRGLPTLYNVHVMPLV